MKTEMMNETEQTNTFESGRSRYSKKRHGLIRRALGKIFSPVTKVLDSVAFDFSNRSGMKKTLIAVFKLKGPICVLIVLTVLLSAGYFVIKSNNQATTEMSLNYEESSSGLNPNSTHFNIYDIASQEVVEDMLTYVGIDPESVDLNSIINGISVRPTNKKTFSDDDFFISTTYKITLEKPSSLKGVRTEDLLSFLCKAYKDKLYANYTENRSILDFDIEELNDEEFMEIADLLDLKAQQIEKYLNTRVKQSKTFTEKTSDETFKSLVQKVDDLRDYDIAKYRAFVLTTGCTHDKASYIRSLTYTNLIKSMSYNKDISAYNVHNDGIRMYNEAMINVVMIPSIDQSKHTYYMSKTKTGMDYMASQADNYLLTAQETEKEIEINRDIISKMDAGENLPADIEKATSMIAGIHQKFADLSKQIETVDKAYIKYKTKDYVTFKDANLSLIQKADPSRLIIIAAAAFLVVLTLIWLRLRLLNGGNKE